MCCQWLTTRGEQCLSKNAVSSRAMHLIWWILRLCGTTPSCSDKNAWGWSWKLKKHANACKMMTTSDLVKRGNKTSAHFCRSKGCLKTTELFCNVFFCFHFFFSDQRVRDIQFLKKELELKLEETILEIDVLTALQSRVVNALEACKEPLRVTVLCLEERWVGKIMEKKRILNIHHSVLIFKKLPLQLRSHLSCNYLRFTDLIWILLYHDTYVLMENVKPGGMRSPVTLCQ